MEVWVRSQDKERFLLIKGVRFCKYKKGYFEKNKTLKEIAESEDAYGVDCNGEIFGEYATKERCLEIIDEIQSLFCDFLICKDVSPCDHPQFKKLGLTSIHYLGKDFDPTIEYHERSSIVYEMPKE